MVVVVAVRVIAAADLCLSRRGQLSECCLLLKEERPKVRWRNIEESFDREI